MKLKLVILIISLMNLSHFGVAFNPLKAENKTADLRSTTAAGSVRVFEGSSTVTLKNQHVTITITKENAKITSVIYDGSNILTGGHAGGVLYWSWNMPKYQNPAGCTYELTVDPSENNFDYAEIKLHMTWDNDENKAAQDVDIYYGIKDGVSGIYAAGKLIHPENYPANPGGEWRMAGYVGSQFDWMVVDSARNMRIPARSASYVEVPGAPKEVSRITSGPFTNHYECKYDYSADYGDTHTWGWVSTTTNRGIWMTLPSLEYYPGGPMKRELMCHSAPVFLNMFGGTHYAMGIDGGIASGEKWEKLYGPFLIYCNKVSKSTTDVPNALWEDAKAQTKLEQAQWPYSWFSDTTYLQANERGTVEGKLVINDATEPSASAANMWVGVAITPSSTTGATDFQMWSKNYQFWVKTDNEGNFTIPNVKPGLHNLYAFGSGVAGQMTKTNFVTVEAGATTDLGVVEWIPTRHAPTIWEIGIPDRTAKEFRHGDDYWYGGTYPDPNWAKFMVYAEEFPNDINYTVGESDWRTDWNFVQPYNIVGSAQSKAPEWKVNFELEKAPTSGSNSSLYVAAASSFAGPLIVKVNGTNITTPSTGVNFPNSSNATIRKGIHGAFGDLRFTFRSSLLKAGNNVISFTQRRERGDIQYDYLRLEAPGTKLVASVASEAKLSDITVYPNPFTNAVQIETGVNFAQVDIQIISIDGRLVYQEHFINTGESITLDLSHLNSGIYLLKLTSDKSESYRKIIKQ